MAWPDTENVLVCGTVNVLDICGSSSATLKKVELVGQGRGEQVRGRDAGRRSNVVGYPPGLGNGDARDGNMGNSRSDAQWAPRPRRTDES